MLSPATTGEVAAVVRLCAQEDAALVPQGGNRAMVGGATPDSSGTQLFLSLRRMNRLRATDEQAQLAVVEAGLLFENCPNAVMYHGLGFPVNLVGKDRQSVGQGKRGSARVNHSGRRNTQKK